MCQSSSRERRISVPMTEREDRTYRQLIAWGSAQLAKEEIDNVEHDAFALLAETFQIDRVWYLMHCNEQADAVQAARYEALIQARRQHIPLQHLTGKAAFWGREFVVNEQVLVPRFDTEVLIEEALKYVTADSKVLDMCTGSGCIAITLALETGCSVMAVDVSKQALEVAQKNKELLAATQVELIQSDLFERLRADQDAQQFDCIVSNPPYIATCEIQALSREVREHDPLLALDGHEDGLFFYRKITKESAAFLKSGGRLIYEIGYNQAEAVCKLMQENGFVECSVIKDLAGMDRVVRGRLY